jgi:two-component system NtrC family response regulator
MIPRVVLIEDDESLNYILTHFLQKNKYEVESFTDGMMASQKIMKMDMDVAVIDVNLGQVNGLQILKNLKQIKPEVPVIMITAFGNINDAVMAIKQGAYDYLVKPFKEIELVQHIKNALKQKEMDMSMDLSKSVKTPAGDQIIGESQGIKDLLKTIMDVSESDVNVIISGETGTGKELVAKAIHANSQRKNDPFIAFNCAAIPENLLESELFGHMKGSFTGAIKDKKGKFELADKGTIFLDEITEMPVHLQAKLLRVVQEKEIEPVGSHEHRSIDVRFISATNKNIEQEIKEERFRQDLFFRLGIYPVEIPPLRARQDDIPLLISHFIEQQKLNVKIAKSAMQKLKEYKWPGNIRELQNVLNYSAVNVDDGMIEVEHLPEKIFNTSDLELDLSGKSRTLAEYEKEIIINALEGNKGNQTKTAKELGVTRAVLLYKMKKLGL